jgi:dienelactone hydrolase
MRRLAHAFAFLACALLAGALPSRAALQEQVVELAVTAANARGQSVTHPIKLTIFRDDAIAKSPFLILNHGRAATREDHAKLGRARYSDNSKYFVGKGFAVFVPTRIGYGVSGGPDVENSGGCRSKNYPPVYEATAQHTLQILAYARTLPFVDGERGIALGQSFGGTAAITIAAKNTPGVVAAVNFAGGGGGNPTERPGDPCRPDQLRKLFADYGATARIPTLWLYSENDKYFGKEHPQAWFKAFVAAGGKGEFVQLPAHGEDGHGSFTRNPAAWRPAFEAFLRRNGF